MYALYSVCNAITRHNYIHRMYVSCTPASGRERCASEKGVCLASTWRGVSPATSEYVVRLIITLVLYYLFVCL